MDCDRYGCQKNIEDYASGSSIDIKWIIALMAVLVLLAVAFVTAVLAYESFNKKKYISSITYASVSGASLWICFVLINWNELIYALKGYGLLLGGWLVVGAIIAIVVYLIKTALGLFSTSIKKDSTEEFFDRLVTYAQVAAIAIGGVISMLFPIALLLGLVLIVIKIFK